MAQTTLRDYLQITEDAISAGHIDDAMEKCQHILAFFPESLEAQRLLGKVYLAQGQLEEAQQTFDWILANDPENVIVYCDRAIISERMSDMDTALDCYQQAYELSRGNSQIRQEFNALSAKVGQQDFMFSRAGLARLYMRGDLLPQALQEWEAVLNANPDRLDARTGLLETYWREGLYDQVEQLATQILEDIPGCLKALLLLAHVISIYDIEQARDLLQRAEAMDPEMAMAHDLFSDLIAGQPNDPFVALLKKGPVIVPESLDDAVVGSSMKAVEIVSPALTSESSDSHLGWASLESWSELDTQSVPQQPAQPIPESSAHARWSSDSMQKLDMWAALGQPVQGISEPGAELEVWEEPEEVEKDLKPIMADDETTIEEQSWYQAEHDVQQVDAAVGGPWDSLSSLSAIPSMDPWETDSQEPGLPSPPAWLDMLTRGDGAMAVHQPPPSIEQEPPAVSQMIADQPDVEPAQSAQIPMEAETELQPEREQEPTFFFASDDKDAEMGWPEWLKSLGAATMEPEPAQDDGLLEAFIAVAEPQGHAPRMSWLDSLEQERSVAQSLPTNEHQLVTSLESLEYDLHAQGFVPLEPGSLSTIAQEHQEQIPTLSSALAQLGELTHEPIRANDVPQPIQLADASQVTSALSEGAVEPLSSAPEPVPTFDPVLSSDNATSQEPVSISPSAGQASLSPTLETAPVSNASSVAGPPLIPGYRVDALLENELETTMKRPSIRLQPMQQRVPAQQEQSLPVNKRPASERAGSNKTSDDGLTYKERLLKGYHAQLDGTYDDAMQEYRIIIRSAPELLGEVISNLRALLKLVPRYAIGYRVLGDAYMRQGEYLQAMEAYNKALNMAKKAKSQGSS